MPLGLGLNMFDHRSVSIASLCKRYAVLTNSYKVFNCLRSL